MYEMRLGFDGTMPGAPYADVYARIWNLYQSGKHDEARDVFAKLLLMSNWAARLAVSDLLERAQREAVLYSLAKISSGS